MRTSSPMTLRRFAAGAVAGGLVLALSCRPEVSAIRQPRRALDEVPRFEGTIALDKNLPPARVVQHPHLAANGRALMHVDAASSDTYDISGPHGAHSTVHSASLGLIGGECSTLNFDRQGRLIALCVKLSRPRLHMFAPDTLQQLAEYELPRRSTRSFELRRAMQDTSGGSYFFLDDRDRAVVGTSEGAIEIIAVQALGFEHVRSIDLHAQLALRSPPDRITAVMPDWDGRYWFTGRHGVVGVVTGEEVHATVLPDEEIENSFSVGPDGVYIVSDHALYRYQSGPDNSPVVVWRASYDRGTKRKIGQINQGSGTTPTLLGESYVAIVDNAEPRENVLVYHRSDGRQICKTPVFAPGASATENSLIGYQRSLIVENNAGYDLFTSMRGSRVSAPGVARVDIRANESGCDVVWTSAEISQTVVHKLSTVTGLVYLYTKLPHPEHDLEAFYLTGVDFESGATVFRSLVGTGMRFDNNWAELALGPSGAAYVGVLNGVVRIADVVTPEP
ncbi:MAG TPA: hypothetical protein VI299_20080 [Polyangiales bacterium]